MNQTSQLTTLRLTVLQVLPALSSGGVERGTLEVGQHLARLGHRSLVLSAEKIHLYFSISASVDSLV